MNKLGRWRAVLGPTMAAGLIMVIAAPVYVFADHVGAHLTPCNDPNTVGGGAIGNSQGAAGPVGPPNSLGWDVGTGQCNGSFTVTLDPTFPSESGGGIELGLRIEQRSVGQVTNNAGDYTVQTGNDTTQPNVNRDWWNFQQSIAYDGNINGLDSLTFTIRTDVGPNLPSAPSFDMLGVVAPSTTLRDVIDDRNNQPNPTSTFSDLYQTSQNPEFSWFNVDPDTTVPVNGVFDYSKEGAWRMALTAEKDGHTASVSICVHTPNASCLPVTDHFLCYNASRVTGKPSNIPVHLLDQFGEFDTSVLKPLSICVPVSKNGEGINDTDTHLVCYEIKDQPLANKDVVVTNQFTEGQNLKAMRPNVLCVPSTKTVQ